MASVRKWKAGATTPSIADDLIDSSGNPIDLTEAEEVRFIMRSDASGSVTVQGTAVSGGSTGNVRYDWGTADLSTPGMFRAYWEIDYGEGRVEKLPQGGAFAGDPDDILIRVTPGG